MDGALKQIISIAVGDLFNQSIAAHKFINLRIGKCFFKRHEDPVSDQKLRAAFGLVVGRWVGATLRLRSINDSKSASLVFIRVAADEICSDAIMAESSNLLGNALTTIGSGGFFQYVLLAASIGVSFFRFRSSLVLNPSDTSTVLKRK
jgi:hypothetical protein